jgi:hypothetical protein
MDTLIDITILLTAYASLSLFCAAMLRLLWTSPQRHASYEQVNSRGW